MSPGQPDPIDRTSSDVPSYSDITRALPRHSSVVYCPDCNRYLFPPSTWLVADVESPQLLILLLRLLTKYFTESRLRLSHCEFVRTEPHSKTIMIKVMVLGEIASGAIVEQPHIVEFKVCDRLCDRCSIASVDPDQWVAKVQLRQHVDHRRTFFYLEQLILKHRVAKKAIKIVETEQGIDFMFKSKGHAVEFLYFIDEVVPVNRSCAIDSSLVSHSSNYSYRHTFSVQISPICRDDLICLPQSMAKGLGNLGPIVICTKVMNIIALMDPLTLRMAFLNRRDYWRVPFKALLSSRQLVEYIVLDVEVDSPGLNLNESRSCMAHAQVVRVSDIGKNDNIFMIRTHLGHLLNPGDYALGYDLCAANINDDVISMYRGIELPEVILIKKCYREKRQMKRGNARKWKLKRLNMEAEGKIDKDKRDDEYELFLRDLEENPESRLNISLYKSEEYQQSEMDSGHNSPQIDEMLADLVLCDSEEDSDLVGLME